LAPCLLSCAAKKPEQFSNDQTLYQYALKLFENHDYAEAITFFESLRNRFPQSPFLLDSELKIADAHFEKGEYAEAEVSYQTFRSLHPTNIKIPYVVLRLAICHFKRIPRGIDRDQTHTEKAIAIFEELTLRWPNSSESKEARPLLLKCRRALGEREMYVANFYLKNRQYNAAIQRLANLRENMDFHELKAEATYKLGYAHLKMDNVQQAKEILSELLNNPSAKEFHARARTLLKRAGTM